MTELNHQNYLIGIRKKTVLEEKSVEKESIDLIVTSPPYNVGIDYGSNEDNLIYKDYLNFSQIWLKNCYVWTKNTGRLCLNIPLDKNKNGKNSVYVDITTIAKKVGWKYQTTIIWNEQNISKRTAWGSWLSASAPCIISPVEVIVVFYKNEWKKIQLGESDITREEFIEWTNGLWTFNGENSKKVNHPTPFPRELPKRCIKLFSFLGNTVLDPFSGSGTTLIETINNQRYALGLEIDEQYIFNSKIRIAKECYFNNTIPSKEKFVTMLDYIINISKKNKSAEIYYKIFGKNWGKNITSASNFVKKSWEKIEFDNILTKNYRGTLFEYLIIICLYSKKILPFYQQAKIGFVPNVNYDIVFYNSKGYPITLSIKTSLRERYKQADLEGSSLKNVHRRAKNYLITLDKKEYKKIKEKIERSDVGGLDEIILADTQEFDKLLDKLAKMNFIKTESIEIIKGKIIE